MSTTNGQQNFEDFEDDPFFDNFLDDQQNTQASDEKFLEEQKKLLECEETIGEDFDPKPEKSLNFEEAWKTDKNSTTYESKYKTIPFLKEDVGIVNSMSHVSPDDIAKLIRNIQNSVYILGMDEARECRRGKLLGVLKEDETK
ncbi:unnamed protein product [Caenorhabditis angaria]|uniref:Uncharacterized protein n=1 Tax=Caenorhabditis angaria TaxID=860376 RepID=A0A9P1IGE4_9PELO|nr:unnamed protein product [Caenorhabditis angaria]